MAFRVLIAGTCPIEYARLRDALDRVLVHRLPDVLIVTMGGKGVPALAASYATARGLECVAVTLDYAKHRANAAARQIGEALALADAVVVVGDSDHTAREVLAHAKAKGLPVCVLHGGEARTG